MFLSEASVGRTGARSRGSPRGPDTALTGLATRTVRRLPRRPPAGRGPRLETGAKRTPTGRLCEPCPLRPGARVDPSVELPLHLTAATHRHPPRSPAVPERRAVAAVWWTGDAVTIIDQRRLPEELVDWRLDDGRGRRRRRSRTLAVRGAPAIGITGAYGLVDRARRGAPGRRRERRSATRPTPRTGDRRRPPDGGQPGRGALRATVARRAPLDRRWRGRGPRRSPEPRRSGCTPRTRPPATRSARTAPRNSARGGAILTHCNTGRARDRRQRHRARRDLCPAGRRGASRRCSRRRPDRCSRAPASRRGS